MVRRSFAALDPAAPAHESDHPRWRYELVPRQSLQSGGCRLAALALLRYRPIAGRKVGKLRLRGPNPDVDRRWWAPMAVDRAVPPEFRRQALASLGRWAWPRHSISALPVPRPERALVRRQWMKVRVLVGVLAVGSAFVADWKKGKRNCSLVGVPTKSRSLRRPPRQRESRGQRKKVAGG